MKIKIKSFNGELPEYLTLGKEYVVISNTIKHGVRIVTDDGMFLSTGINNSPTLNGGSWEIVE